MPHDGHLKVGYVPPNFKNARVREKKRQHKEVCIHAYSQSTKYEKPRNSSCIAWVRTITDMLATARSKSKGKGGKKEHSPD